MNYKLAKQLKEAGFPQESLWTERDQEPSRYYNDNGKRIRYRHFESDTDIKIPTLSELIEACGDRFKSLARSIKGDFFVAEDAEENIDECVAFQTGKTPEEAVVNLWLKLHVK